MTDEGLRSASFAFLVDNVTTLPWAGLQPDELLVNDAPDRLRLLGVEEAGGGDLPAARRAALGVPAGARWKRRG